MSTVLECRLTCRFLPFPNLRRVPLANVHSKLSEISRVSFSVEICIAIEDGADYRREIKLDG